MGSKLRYDHARDAEDYDNPTQTAGAGRHSPVMFAADALFIFDQVSPSLFDPRLVRVGQHSVA